jgi:hypothetical protein
MSATNRDSILIGLNYVEAVLKNDDDMKSVINETVSKDELIHALLSVSMIMTGVATRENATGATYFDTIGKARKIALGKTEA